MVLVFRQSFENRAIDELDNKNCCIFFASVLVPYDQVVAQLAGDTLDKVSSLGLKGKRFMPEEFSQLACVSLKVKFIMPLLCTDHQSVLSRITSLDAR